MAYLVLVSVSIFSITGCAVLTSSQVDEIKRFSQATDAYTNLPGNLTRLYGELLRDSQLLDLSIEEFNTDDPLTAESAWNKIVVAYDSEQTFSQLGNRMDTALHVLKIYSDLLGKLASDDYTESLDKSSERLGKSLREAIDTYNDNFRKDDPLPFININIARGARLAGGLFLRYRQAQVLKDVIEKADPLVQELMDDVREISNIMADNYKHYEDDDLKVRFKNVAIEMGRLNTATYTFVYNNISRARAGQKLAEKVGKSATTYASAHRALLNNTRIRMNIRGMIDQIQVLRNEIKAAKDIGKKLEKLD
jgi:hypothetical protein